MNFDHKLLRLKQCLGVTTDLEVATALELSKTAFAERKRRGAFPVDNLMVLAGKNKNVDVSYVLTGKDAKRDADDLEFVTSQFIAVEAYAKNMLDASADKIGEERPIYLNRVVEITRKFVALDEQAKLAVEAMIDALSTKNKMEK